jgi:hypothetical protein
MSLGPGKYDDFCKMVREDTRAEGCIVIVVNGTRGNGFAVQASPEVPGDLLQALFGKPS